MKSTTFINECVLDGQPPLSTLQDAFDALRIIEAAERSARERVTVDLAYDTILP